MKSKLPIIKIFVKRLDAIMSAHNIPSGFPSRSKVLSETTDMTPQACRKWLKGESIPEYENMMKIAARFSVTTSYLIGEVNLKTFGRSDEHPILKNSVKSGVISIDIYENLFNGLLQNGDTVLCEPTNSVDIDGEIYLMQSAQKRFFRVLRYDDNKKLVITNDDAGKLVDSIYEDQAVIDLFLSSLVGRVQAVIRKVKSVELITSNK